MKVAEAGYPTGFLIAPVFIYPNWKEEYRNSNDGAAGIITKIELKPAVVQVDEVYKVNPIVLDLNLKVNKR